MQKNNGQRLNYESNINWFSACVLWCLSRFKLTDTIVRLNWYTANLVEDLQQKTETFLADNVLETAPKSAITTSICVDVLPVRPNDAKQVLDIGNEEENRKGTAAIKK